jgi:hypothetical protein
LALLLCMAISMGPRNFIAACGAAGEPSAAMTSASLVSSSSSDFESGRRRELRDLVRKASEARGRYSDVTRKIGRLESDLATIQAVLCTSEEETASTLAEAADARAWAAGAVAEPPELFRLKCASHRYTADTNSTHFKRNNPLVFRVSARCNRGSTGSKQVYLARRRVYNCTTAHQFLIHRILNIITNVSNLSTLI